MSLTREEHLQNLWLRSQGLPPRYQDDATSTFHQTLGSERCLLFERLRANRKTIGYLRYGALGHHNKPKWDRVTRCERLLYEYRETGNLECLVDLGNLAELEFAESIHPNAHFAARDDGEHTQAKT